MPKRTDIKKILVIGSGPIVIGQACEFDYAGTQALKALKAEGYEVILANSNPATIMTDPEFSTRTYIEPLTVELLERIIEKEAPHALLPILGGQTALNLTLDLHKAGVLAKHNVEILGASPEAIHLAEDRELFKKCMQEIGAEMPRSVVVRSMEEGRTALAQLGLPLILRPSFTLGGTGGGIVRREDEFEAALQWALSQSPNSECLLEESVLGWKEYELEVMRDSLDRCVIICSIENLDPMGVHTGDSITVAPQMTLSDREYQAMREEAFRVMRRIGVACGGSNVQFAVDPKTGRRTVIEMNPRVSRSSALASKATGFPIAKIAALLSVGYTLDEITNDITRKTKAAFEPSIDYVVVKIPRFAFEKFPGSSDVLGTQMKSVGEVMAIGRTFNEAMQKALRSLEIDKDGFGPELDVGRLWETQKGKLGPKDRSRDVMETIHHKLTVPGPRRIFALADALRFGMSAPEIAFRSGIDPWFVTKIAQIIDEERSILDRGLTAKPTEKLVRLKRMGFSDSRIARLLTAHGQPTKEHEIRKLRVEAGVLSKYRQVDTCAAEFQAETPYLYGAYEEGDEALPTDKKKIVILGGGPNRIGQGIEFDYCCVHGSFALKAAGYETVMINCNPETVSTDYDTSDRLYFEPVTLEDVLEICRRENCAPLGQPGKLVGVIVQYGGQTPLKLAEGLVEAGVPILGTTYDAIDRAEDRKLFSEFLRECGLSQPESGVATSVEQAVEIGKRIGFPVITRPSYVLGGRAMEVVYDEADLRRYMVTAVTVSNERPVLVERFLQQATEVDVDAICDGKEVVIGGILEHIEEAGVHSGDAAMSLPPHALPKDTLEEIIAQTKKMALKLPVRGLLNVQFAVQAGKVYVLEVNPRASRTVPFVSKATNVALAKLGVLVMAGKTLAELRAAGHAVDPPKLDFSTIKASVFPFNKFPGTDTLLGPEMRSTGEVMGIDSQFHRALLKAFLGAGMRLPKRGTCFLSVRDADKQAVIPIARRLASLGFKLIATDGTLKGLAEAGLKCERINKVAQGSPHIVELIEKRGVDLVINTTIGKQSIIDSFSIRERALRFGVPYFTVLATAREAAESLSVHVTDSLSVKCLQEYHHGR
jgi:carbamoyl-phosphate synthase large subunit